MPQRTVRKGASQPGRNTATSRGNGDQVQSLIRALGLLNRIAEAPDGASLTDLAQQVGLPTSTAHRLLTTLEQERYVRFNHEQRLWTVGVQAFVTGCTFTKTRSLVALARPHMRHLMEEGGETVNLAIVDEGQAVYLAQIECSQMMRVFARPGTRVPLHCSGVGKAILSATSDKSLSRILHQHGMPRLTVKTITAPLPLREELERVRAVGYAVDDEEHAVGLRCIAAPIFDETGDVVAAVSASGPMARIVEERIAPLGGLVLDAARAISAEMGATLR
ncbi:helix-turn-helix domain-containing protein [Gluconacetobacter sp. 1b LMG 1731]|uniref:Helix-turn-helix domain-containing protein n=1 Tax=Gluconacetobacter dulcium TaxID=2729096 RepID=A0A7W4INX4_9PROT|nr:IclR family transcriptional regulator C-terminal domain-containing protein [Gluconacetobacter dulcium]MBB2166400.1 helix-turn-helix domain-containing protein [Gluconacetobacter dulcium]MBB2195537.1 helix-turn-helix domain-containing protein [Gluconacetobacter dulcium]